MATLEYNQDYYIGRFSSMASPCEILIDTKNKPLASKITEIAEIEAARIEKKYSRYQNNNVIHQINTGKEINVDEETARLLDYAQKLFELSNGLFDITAGVLRRAWHFDGSDNIPEQSEIESLLPLIGMEKVHWKNSVITLPPEMEIDLGGIGKEYAVDRASQLITAFINSQDLDDVPISVLLNFGGDICVSNPTHSQGRTWTVGIDTGIGAEPENNGSHQDNNEITQNHVLIKLTKGGVATSGDSRRFLKKNHVRYSHILDPRTGWPVPEAPTSVTVAAETCTDAGMISTLALLHGTDAESFLKDQQVDYWLRW